MSTGYINKEDISEFLTANRENFKEKLLSEALNVRNKIQDILEKGNIDLLKNAENLAIYIAENREKELVEFAKIEGVAWAQHSLTLSFKLEWVHAIRRTVWHFLYEYENLNAEKEFSLEKFFDLEKQINDRVDQFLNNFFISYSNYKDEQLLAQRKLVENLSVPIIPINSVIAALPLIGMIDSHRIKTLEERVLMGISSMGIQTLIIDLSGIAEMELDVIVQFERILNGIKMLGCKTVLTGLRVELVKNMINAGISFDSRIETKGTLQQTLNEQLLSNTGI
ncbi:MAG: STAS domain-containing protein [Bacillota bacterium]